MSSRSLGELQEHCLGAIRFAIAHDGFGAFSMEECTEQRRLLLRRLPYMSMAKTAMGAGRQPVSNGPRETDESFLKRHRLDSVETLICRKKAVWIGHIQRGSDEQFRLDFWNSRVSGSNLWWEQTERDFNKYKTTVDEIADMAHQPKDIRKKFSNL